MMCNIAHPVFGNRPKRPDLETAILTRVRDYLTEQGIRHVRIHCGVVFRGPHAMHLAPKGTPDLVLEIPAGRRVVNPSTQTYDRLSTSARIAWVETKTMDGRLSKEQKQFQRSAWKAKALYWIVRSRDEMRFWLPPVGELDFG